MKTVRSLVLVVVLGATLAGIGSARSEPGILSDEDAITAAALDYIEGWYAGDGNRMERALHPDLAKRIVRVDPASGKSVLQHMTADQLVDITASGAGTRTPEEKRQKDVTILDRFENVAVVKVVAADWVDYLQIARFDGEWKIVNVLWELKPRRE